MQASKLFKLKQLFQRICLWIKPHMHAHMLSCIQQEGQVRLLEHRLQHRWHANCTFCCSKPGGADQEENHPKPN